MIKKVTTIETKIAWDDTVELSWFDLHKPNLTAVTQKNIDFILKVNAKHLHEDDVLVCEDGYKIKVLRAQDEIYELNFKNPLEFARYAYEIGNRHQPILLEEYKITILNDISLQDIITQATNAKEVDVQKIMGYFKSNAKAHHSH